MMFKDKNGIEVCQLGTGDVMVGGIEWPDISSRDCVGIGFSPIKRGEINRKIEGAEGKKDIETGMKFKLLFTETASIDVVISKLQEAKELMINEAQAIPAN